MRLHERIESVASKEDLATFVAELRRDLLDHRTDWENPTLERFLEAMGSWIEEMDNYYRNTAQEEPINPSWKTFADILYASKTYE